MFRVECTGRALSVDVEIAILGVDLVSLDVARIVRDVEQKWQLAMAKKGGQIPGASND